MVIGVKVVNLGKGGKIFFEKKVFGKIKIFFGKKVLSAREIKKIFRE